MVVFSPPLILHFWGREPRDLLAGTLLMRLGAARLDKKALIIQIPSKKALFMKKFEMALKLYRFQSQSKIMQFFKLGE